MPKAAPRLQDFPVASAAYRWAAIWPITGGTIDLGRLARTRRYCSNRTACARGHSMIEDVPLASTERLRAVVESSPIGLLMVDARGVIVLVNAEVERLFGHPRSAMQGAAVETLLPERFRGRHPAFRSAFGEDPRARKMGAGRELRALRADGTEFPVEIGLTPVSTGEGLFVIGSIVDITARLEAEASRIRLEEQLRQAQKMEALGTLAGGVAHDFNNILAAIVGLGELAARAVADRPSVAADISEILDAARRGKELVDRILRFSRRTPMQMQTIDVAETVHQLTRLLQASLPPSIVIETRLPPRPARVRGDVTSLQQVLMNLATNAAHAMPNGGTLQIEVGETYVRDSVARARPELREGPYVRIAVRDTGRGMDEGTRLKAFEPFFTTKPPGEGSGLGLPLVHGIMRDHQGSVELESEVGKGTEVRCLLPAVEGEGANPMDETPMVPGTGLARIIYLDDERTLASVGRRQLESLGYRVTSFSDAHAALDALRCAPHEVDLVVTDYLMPGMTGMQFARAVQEVRPGIPVLVLSGFIGHFTAEELRLGGVRRVLQKPVGGVALAEAIRGALAGE
jgi:PAS domain S-box-containing protein